jgi:hypothetical protein
MPDDAAQWTLRAYGADRATHVLDPAYWDARQAFADVYVLRMAVGEAYVLGGRNFSSAHPIHFVDTTQLVGAAVTLLPNAGAAFSPDSVCAGFPPNMTRPWPEPLDVAARKRVRSLLIAGALLTALLLPLAVVLFLGGMCYRARYLPGSLRDTCLGRNAADQKPAWSSLDEAGGPADAFPCSALCGSTTQALCFCMLQWAPPCAAWVTSLLERMYRPRGRRGRSGFADARGAQQVALYTNDATLDVALPGSTASASTSQSQSHAPPASASDAYADDDDVSPPQMVEVHLGGQTTPACASTTHALDTPSPPPTPPPTSGSPADAAAQ